MRGYFSSQISDNISKTPEGYLLCHDVRIARTGWQSYSGEEWGDPTKAVVRVWRGPEAVFAPDTLESGEGKTITFNHPPQWVGPSNESAYSRGVSLNVRRDPTPDPDGTEYMLGDLLIKDASLIQMVEHNQTREVSLGYNFVPGKTQDGHAAQTRIIINHVAIVPKGRAGSTVAIRDHAGKVTKKPMKIFDHLIGLGLAEYGKTASPEELAAASRALISSSATTRRATDAAPDDDEEEQKKKDKEAKDAKAAKDAQAAKDARGKDGDGAEPGISEKLDKLIALLSPAAAGDAADPEIVLDPDEIPTNPIPGADAKGKDADDDKDKDGKKGEDSRKAALDALMRVKPIVAATGDQKAIDAFNLQVRQIKGTASGQQRQATDAYKALARGGKKPDLSLLGNGMRTATDAARINGEFEAAAKKMHRKATVN